MEEAAKSIRAKLFKNTGFCLRDGDLMDRHGNYNIEVLEALLVHNHLRVTREEKMAEHPFTGVRGYLIGTGTHWLAVAPVGGVWFKLDSLNRFPEPIDEAHFKRMTRGQNVFSVQ